MKENLLLFFTLLVLLIVFTKSENIFIHLTSKSHLNHPNKIGHNGNIYLETDRTNLKDVLLVSSSLFKRHLPISIKGTFKYDLIIGPIIG